MADKGRFTMGWLMRGGVLAAIGAGMASAALPAAAADGPSMGEARAFAVLAGSTVSSTGLTTVTGDVGVSPGTGMTGFPPAIVTGGSIHVADGRATEAHRDASLAYAFLKGMASVPANDLTDQDLGGMTLPPGVYKFSSSAQLTGALTLNARGNSNALFVFQIGSALTTATGASVVVINGGADYDESRVYWQIGSSATLGTGTAFIGNILAYASISMVTGATMSGNALALNGAVTMESNSVVSAPHAEDRRMRHPARGTSMLTPPDGSLDTNAIARITVNHFPERRRRVERSWFKLNVGRLDSSTGYTIWADNPSTPETDLVQIDSFTTGRNGTYGFGKDTRRGDSLPFGMTLANLSGVAIEVRDSGGTTTLLAGTIPTTSP